MPPCGNIIPNHSLFGGQRLRPPKRVVKGPHPHAKPNEDTKPAAPPAKEEKPAVNIETQSLEDSIMSDLMSSPKKRSLESKSEDDFNIHFNSLFPSPGSESRQAKRLRLLAPQPLDSLPISSSMSTGLTPQFDFLDSSTSTEPNDSILTDELAMQLALVDDASGSEANSLDGEAEVIDVAPPTHEVKSMVPYDQTFTITTPSGATINPLDPTIKMCTGDLDWVGPTGAFEFKDWEQEARAMVAKSPPKTMKNISDEQLAFADLRLLMNLMNKEKYTSAQIEGTKKLRRKCKNRLSAKGSASKRRVQMSSIAAVNNQLLQCVLALKNQNTDLHESNIQLQRHASAASEERNQLRQFANNLQNEVNSLRAMTQVNNKQLLPVLETSDLISSLPF